MGGRHLSWRKRQGPMGTFAADPVPPSPRVGDKRVLPLIKDPKADGALGIADVAQSVVPDAVPLGQPRAS
jgi:hypothetical protein